MADYNLTNENNFKIGDEDALAVIETYTIYKIGMYSLYHSIHYAIGIACVVRYRRLSTLNGLIPPTAIYFRRDVLILWIFLGDIEVLKQ